MLFRPSVFICPEPHQYFRIRWAAPLAYAPVEGALGPSVPSLPYRNILLFRIQHVPSNCSFDTPCRWIQVV